MEGGISVESLIQLPPAWGGEGSMGKDDPRQGEEGSPVNRALKPFIIPRAVQETSQSLFQRSLMNLHSQILEVRTAGARSHH